MIDHTDVVIIGAGPVGIAFAFVGGGGSFAFAFNVDGAVVSSLVGGLNTDWSVPASNSSL